MAVVSTALVSLPAGADLRLVPEEFATIQGAIDASASSDTVLIAPGVYRGPGNRDIEFRGRDIVVKSREGAASTIIDCESAGRGFYLHEWETRAARIEGLTIINGRATEWPDLGGGAVCCALSSPTIVDCVAHENTAMVGGALDLSGFDGVVERCVISGNEATSSGGGIELAFGAGEVRDCLVAGNRSRLGGGGLDLATSSSHRFSGCTVTANEAWDGEGGGICSFAVLDMERCIVWGNCARWSDEIDPINGGEARCCAVNDAGVNHGYYLPFTYDPNCIFTDPVFCGPFPCGETTQGDWTLHADSPCLPEHSPCGELIGALGRGCGIPTPTGACCLSDMTCVVVTREACEDQQGTYMGDERPCEPDTCITTATKVGSWGRIKAMYR